MRLARNLIFKLSILVFSEDRKVVDFDEQTKSKRGGERTCPSARMHLMTQIVTNYKGFKRTLPSSELYVHENHQNPLTFFLGFSFSKCMRDLPISLMVVLYLDINSTNIQAKVYVPFLVAQKFPLFSNFKNIKVIKFAARTQL